MSLLMKLKALMTEVVGKSVPSPPGQLAGHAGGLPFETLVHELLEKEFDGRAYRHYEALNKSLEMEYKKTGNDSIKPDFQFGNPDINFLVSRGKSAIEGWRVDNQFVEKQNDTAESIIFSGNDEFFESELVTLVDVKTQNIAKTSQPPNIISAKKIAQLSETVLRGRFEPSFEILYCGIKFMQVESPVTKVLTAADANAISLTRINPESLYINWAAATQIQFHPFEVDQSFRGSTRQWLESYLGVYCKQLDRRVQKQLDEVKKYENLLSSI